MLEAVTRAAPEPQTRRAFRFDGFIVVATLTVLAFAVNRWGAELVRSHHVMKVAFPPFHAAYDPRLGRAALPVITLAAVLLAVVPGLTARLTWRALVWCSAGVSVLWTIALNATDGWYGLLHGIDNRNEYLPDVGAVRSPIGFLHGFTDHIGEYATHTRGHPPGFVLILWSLDRIGLGGARWAAALCIGGGAIAVVAVLTATRDIAGDRVARSAMPFVAIAPIALWIGTSADGFYAGIGAVSIALVIRALSRPNRGSLAFAGGISFGVLMLCSYGLVLLAVVPIAVAWKKGRMAALVPAGVGTAAILGLAYAAGFNYLAGMLATRREYFEGVASMRPYSYAFVADLVTFALILGPAVVLGCVRSRNPRLWALVGGAVLAVILADLSGMSKLEVERIWLPFAFWVLPAAATLTIGARATMARRWMAIQMACAIAFQVTVRTAW